MFKPTITKEEIHEMPIARFDGEISLVDDIEKVDSAIKELRKHRIVGIDTETKPSFVKGKTNKVCLMQISTDNHCYLFRLNKINLPENLVRFLADKRIKKVGLSLKDDIAALNKHHRFKPANIIDIQSIAKDYGILELSLQKIYAIIFHQKISKSQQLSNWEISKLSSKQKNYAAMDAWGCLQIYNTLQKEKPLTKKELELLRKEYAEN